MHKIIIKVSTVRVDRDLIAEARLFAKERDVLLMDPVLHETRPEVHALTLAPMELLLKWFFEESHSPNKLYPMGTLLLYSELAAANQNKVRLIPTGADLYDIGGDLLLWSDGDTASITKKAVGEIWAGPLSLLRDAVLTLSRKDVSLEPASPSPLPPMCPMFTGAELVEFDQWKLTKCHVSGIEEDDSRDGFEYGPGRNVIEIVAADSVENGEFYLHWMGHYWQSDDMDALERILFVNAKRDGCL